MRVGIATLVRFVKERVFLLCTYQEENTHPGEYFVVLSGQGCLLRMQCFELLHYLSLSLKYTRSSGKGKGPAPRKYSLRSSGIVTAASSVKNDVSAHLTLAAMQSSRGTHQHPHRPTSPRPSPHPP